MKIETIKTGVQFRSFELNREEIDTDARTAPLAFSSESPVERVFGIEILDHDTDSVRLGRLNDGGPILVDHDPADHVGVVESVSIDSDRMGRAVARFGNSARAREIWQDVIDGIRKHVSVGYRIHRMREDRDEDDQPPTMRVVDWEPLEISVVAIPADASVGISRADDSETIETIVEIQERSKTLNQPALARILKEENKMTEAKTPALSADDVRKAEIHRIREIEAIGNNHEQPELAREFIQEGKSLDEFRTALLDVVATKGPSPEASVELFNSEKDTDSYSLVRAINALVTQDWSEAGFELEASQAVANRVGKKPSGIYLPMDVQKRDLTAGSATQGDDVVATDLLGASFIDMLRNRMKVIEAGATMLTGLTGNVAIPRMTGGATAYWVAENAAITESDQTFDQVTLSPNSVGAMTDVSRRLLLQGSVDVEALVRSDLATTLAIELDRAAIHGSGSSNQPTGILATSSIGDVAGGANGAAPTFAHVIELESDVATANADVGTLAYLTNSKVRGFLKQVEKASSTGQFVWEGSEVNGYRALVSNQVSSALTKGTNSACSAIIFGNWADLLIGSWGALDVLVDPYTGSSAGTVRIRAMQDVDIAVRHPESFSVMQDASTA